MQHRPCTCRAGIWPLSCSYAPVLDLIVSLFFFPTDEKLSHFSLLIIQIYTEVILGKQKDSYGCDFFPYVLYCWGFYFPIG